MMKTVIVFVASVLCVLSASAQKDSVVVRDNWHRDTVRQRSATVDTLRRDDEMIIWDKTVRDPENGRQVGQPLSRLPRPLPILERPRFKAHWNGYYFGFVNFAKTNYSKYGGDDFMELDWANSFSMQFNFVKYSFGLSRNQRFGIMTGMGFEYMRLCFDDDITIRREKGELLQAVPLTELGIDNVKRSTFKALYLTVPFLVEKQFSVRGPKKIYLSTGFIGGIRLHSKTKVVYTSDKGNKRRWKESGSYTMVPFKVDWTVRAGYRGVGVFANYALTNMFNKNRAPELRPYSVGFGFSF